MAENQLNSKKLGRKYKVRPPFTIFNQIRNPLDDHHKVHEMVEHLFEFSLMTPEAYNKVKETKLFTSYFYPFTEDVDRFVVLNWVMLSFFLLDDHTECEWGDINRKGDKADQIWGQVIESFTKLLNPDKFISMAKWKPYVVAQYIGFEIMYQAYEQDQKNRLTEAYKLWAEANTRESHVIDQNCMVDTIDQMFDIRINSIAGKCLFAMIEYAQGIRLYGQELNDPLIKSYIDNACIVLVICNDFLSFEKEIIESKGHPERIFNCAALIMRKKGLSVEEAIVKTVELYDEYERKTWHIKQELLNRPNIREELKIYIEGIAYIMGGNVATTYAINRYSQNEVDE